MKKNYLMRIIVLVVVLIGVGFYFVSSPNLSPEESDARCICSAEHLGEVIESCRDTTNVLQCKQSTCKIKVAFWDFFTNPPSLPSQAKAFAKKNNLEIYGEPWECGFPARKCQKFVASCKPK